LGSNRFCRLRTHLFALSTQLFSFLQCDSAFFSATAFIFFASEGVADSFRQRLDALAICAVIGALVTWFNHWWFRVWGWHLVPVTLLLFYAGTLAAGWLFGG